MNIKRISCVIAAMMLLTALTSCGCEHEWIDATCTTPKTCSLCDEVAGEAPGHNWLDATCTAAKACKNCDATEGDPLGHDWQEATTEAPTTCARCKVTEGTRLITDPRFTTESTKEFYGTWTTEVVFTGEMMQLEGFDEEMPATLTMEFGKTGEYICDVELEEPDAYIQLIKDYSIDLTYTNFELQGLTRDQANDAMIATYGMTVEEYVDKSVDSIDLDNIFGAFKQDLVYYVGQNGIYSADSWYGEFEPSDYTFNGEDELIIDELTLEEDGEPLVWKRVK